MQYLAAVASAKFIIHQIYIKSCLFQKHCSILLLMSHVWKWKKQLLLCSSPARVSGMTQGGSSSLWNSVLLWSLHDLSRWGLSGCGPSWFLTSKDFFLMHTVCQSTSRINSGMVIFSISGKFKADSNTNTSEHLLEYILYYPGFPNFGHIWIIVSAIFMCFLVTPLKHNGGGGWDIIIYTLLLCI